ncbi:MAG: hypothetical protein KIT84_30365 [Labilithrix sp.]|nr:hypothetical protein [Labilithrix sp.]MCW5815370.1 hypothetical protein [Labilithrix sp.]
MSPTVKKLATDALARAFDEAEDGPPLSEEDRAALREAVADPKWIRMSRGEAFEHIVCSDDE